MTDYHVVAWNLRRRRGLRAINRAMTREEYQREVSGQYDAEFVSLLRPVSREAIDRALAEGRV